MKTVLFDMDGTLTPPREQMTHSMARALSDLQNHGYKIGIVTGSGMEYITQQCKPLFGVSSVDYLAVDYYPCNGTKHYRYCPGQHNPVLEYESHMKEAIGAELYNDVIYKLASFQCRLGNTAHAHKIPLTGNFIDCRGSMINWCPIGRNASLEERKVWTNLDADHNIRVNILDSFFNIDMFKNLVVKLGGSTSFDIFPEGWDKTFVLKNYSEDDQVYFFGDKCDGDGNDRELYEALVNRKNCHAYKTSGPECTIELIYKLLKGSSNE